MSLVIENDEAEHLARELAELRGQDVPQAAVGALRREVLRLRHDARVRHRARGPEDREAVLRAIEEISDRVCRLPVLDDRSADEILGYNEQGHFD